MQEFQKHMKALRVINSFAWEGGGGGAAKGNCRGFDGNYTEVNMQKGN